MRTSRSVRALLTAFAALGGFVAFSNAQSVATAPVGAVSYSFKQGSQLAGVSMVKPAVYSSKVVTVSGANLVLASGSDVGAALTTGVSYYLEIVKDTPNSGLYVGDRFDVNTASTKAAAVGTIVLNTSALENTVSGNPPAALVGVEFVIRPHVTLGGLLADLPGLFVAGDKVTIRENGGASITATLNSGVTAWQAGISNKNSLIVYPGVGFFVVRSSASTTASTFTGSVRTNSFVQILKAGNQVISEGFPVDSAPNPTAVGASSRQFTNAFGATFANGDKLSAYNNNVLTTYTYATGTNRWAAGIANGNVVNLFHPTTASFLTVTTANPNYVQAVPFSL